MSECKACHEKDIRIRAIIAGCRRDKKRLFIAFCVSVGGFIVYATLGKEGIKMILNAVLGVID